MVGYRQLLHLLQIPASVEIFPVPFPLPFELLLQWDYADTCLNLDTHLVAWHQEKISYISITFSTEIISHLQTAKIKYNNVFYFSLRSEVENVWQCS